MDEDFIFEVMKPKEPLCRTCENFQKSNAGCCNISSSGVLVKRNEIHYCTVFYTQIIKEATECDLYLRKNTPHLVDMEKMAYIMETKNIIGFDKPVIEFKKRDDA